MLRQAPLCSNSDAGFIRVSRRGLLFRGFLYAVGGVAAGRLLAADKAMAEDKVPKDQAGYRDAPRAGNRCDRCVQFQAPNGCKIVAGAVSPSGSCNFFAPK
jgi:hypothetical protein